MPIESVGCTVYTGGAQSINTQTTGSWGLTNINKRMMYLLYVSLSGTSVRNDAAAMASTNHL